MKVNHMGNEMVASLMSQCPVFPHIIIISCGQLDSPPFFWKSRNPLDGRIFSTEDSHAVIWLRWSAVGRKSWQNRKQEPSTSLCSALVFYVYRSTSASQRRPPLRRRHSPQLDYDNREDPMSIYTYNNPFLFTKGCEKHGKGQKKSSEIRAGKTEMDSTYWSKLVQEYY